MGIGNRLSTVAAVSLGEDAVDVGLDRNLADVEPGCDVLVREPGADQRQDFALAFGEPIGQRAPYPWAVGCASGRDEPVVDGGVEQGLAVTGCLKGTVDIGSTGVLGQVADCSATCLASLSPRWRRCSMPLRRR